MTPYHAHLYATLVPLLRTPAYWVPLVIFPSLLYSFFGAPPSQSDSEIANFLLASWSAFAVIGIGFFQFGISISQARESLWEDFARTLPAGATPRIFAQATTALCFLTLALGLLWTLANLISPITLDVGQYARLLTTLLIGSIPFVLIGIALGYLMPARGAVPIANLIYLPLSYLGGLWLPPQVLPEIVARISPFTPTRQLGELAWSTVSGSPIPIDSVRSLTLYAGAALILALVMWRRDETQRSA